MTIRCKNCNNEFYLFWHGYDENEPVECKYCDCAIPAEYNEYIKNALGSVWQLNHKIRSKHQDGYTDWFEFGVEEIHVPKDKFK
jgi:hypothetical protein